MNFYPLLACWPRWFSCK